MVDFISLERKRDIDGEENNTCRGKERSKERKREVCNLLLRRSASSKVSSWFFNRWRGKEYGEERVQLQSMGEHGPGAIPNSALAGDRQARMIGGRQTSRVGCSKPGTNREPQTGRAGNLNSAELGLKPKPG
ncbi:hypothetical protein L6452_41360 [Arctium lappa]|uniref:Uncharacterized protein n=1 Tax=Arctium lappa TaxID=4217 RepID=A0ACB8XNV3_ARCLA|nr:hypothetical protein L6452_41360 [Arctium lappa]